MYRAAQTFPTELTASIVSKSFAVLVSNYIKIIQNITIDLDKTL